MKTANERGKGRKRQSWLRLMWNFALYEALPNYTPAGPMALPAGQAAAAGRGGPYIRQALGADEGPVHPQHIEFPMPLRQVFRT